MRDMHLEIDARLDGMAVLPSPLVDRQIETVVVVMRRPIKAYAALHKSIALVRSLSGFSKHSAAILVAELPNIAKLTPEVRFSTQVRPLGDQGLSQ